MMFFLCSFCSLLSERLQRSIDPLLAAPDARGLADNGVNPPAGQDDIQRQRARKRRTASR